MKKSDSILVSCIAVTLVGISPLAEAGAPTAIAEVLAESQPAPFCNTEPMDLDDEQRTAAGDSIEGWVTAASGTFEKSYGNAGFQLSDGTDGVFVLTDGNLGYEKGDRVRATGTPCIQFGTRALRDTTVVDAAEKGPVIFAPRQIGQFEKRPAIPGDPDVTKNWCNCSTPFSATEGLVITVRGTAVADLEQDREFGFKLFLDDGTGVAQVFIDALSGIPADKLGRRLLTEGTDLCVTGVVARFATVGFEMLPRTRKDLRRARPDRENPCRR